MVRQAVSRNKRGQESKGTQHEPQKGFALNEHEDVLAPLPALLWEDQLASLHRGCRAFPVLTCTSRCLMQHRKGLTLNAPEVKLAGLLLDDSAMTLLGEHDVDMALCAAEAADHRKNTRNRSLILENAGDEEGRQDNSVQNRNCTQALAP